MYHKLKKCLNSRSSHQSCSIEKAVLKNFAIFTGKHLCWSLLLIDLRALRPGTFLKGEYCKIFKNAILVKICFCISWFLLLIFLFGCLFLLLIQQAFFKGPLQGLKSSPQGAQWQAPLLFEKKEKLAGMVTRCTTRCHSLSLVVILCHSLSLVVIRCHSLYHSLSLDVPLVCLFINDQVSLSVCLYFMRYWTIRVLQLFVNQTVTS